MEGLHKIERINVTWKYWLDIVKKILIFFYLLYFNYVCSFYGNLLLFLVINYSTHTFPTFYEL